mmetsp:Transcript_12871/g.30098  ORF Transcript_12871/g.30098 Transcript_12871/m.30098 type:complete len:274 (+) Transcript_12871:135-956(+)
MPQLKAISSKTNNSETEFVVSSTHRTTNVRIIVSWVRFAFRRSGETAITEFFPSGRACSAVGVHSLHAHQVCLEPDPNTPRNLLGGTLGNFVPDGAAILVLPLEGGKRKGPHGIVRGHFVLVKHIENDLEFLVHSIVGNGGLDGVIPRGIEILLDHGCFPQFDFLYGALVSASSRNGRLGGRRGALHKYLNVGIRGRFFPKETAAIHRHQILPLENLDHDNHSFDGRFSRWRWSSLSALLFPRDILRIQDVHAMTVLDKSFGRGRHCIFNREF